MATTSTFPVIVGTVVEVSCQPGHTLAGDDTITCVKDVSFTIGQRPACTIGLHLHAARNTSDFKLPIINSKMTKFKYSNAYQIKFSVFQKPSTQLSSFYKIVHGIITIFMFRSVHRAANRKLPIH